MKYIFILVTILFCEHSIAREVSPVKVRAREHYEILTIKDQLNDAQYKGFSNTINIWWEKPYDISFGLSFSPVFSSLKGSKDGSPFGVKVQTINAGLELKVFTKSFIRYLYLRPGLSYTILKPSTLISNRTGISGYIGVGYEVPFKMFGLALEVAYRYSSLDQQTTIQTLSPSIGLHFYKPL